MKNNKEHIVCVVVKCEDIPPELVSPFATYEDDMDYVCKYVKKDLGNLEEAYNKWKDMGNLPKVKI